MPGSLPRDVAIDSELALVHQIPFARHGDLSQPLRAATARLAETISVSDARRRDIDRNVPTKT